MLNQNPKAPQPVKPIFEDFPVFTAEDLPAYLNLKNSQYSAADVKALQVHDPEGVFHILKRGQRLVNRQVIITGRPADIDQVIARVHPSVGMSWSLGGQLGQVKLQNFVGMIKPRCPAGMHGLLDAYADLEIRLVDLVNDESEAAVWDAIGAIYDAAEAEKVIVHADPNLTVANPTDGSGNVLGGNVPGMLQVANNTGNKTVAEVYQNHWAFNSGINLEDVVGERQVQQKGKGARVYILDAISQDVIKHGGATSAPQGQNVNRVNKQQVTFARRKERHNSNDFTEEISIKCYNVPRAVMLGTLPTALSTSHPVDVHGLYVTALLKRVAPAATFNIFNVLNEYGSGEIFSLICTLFQVIDDALGQQSPYEFPLVNTVINMSLEASITEENMIRCGIRGKLRKLLSSAGNTASPVMLTLLQEMISGFHYVPSLHIPVQIAHRLGAALVASSGNESAEVFGRMPTAIPARFDEVLDVGASNFWGGMSSYSNQANILAPGGGKEDPEDPDADLAGLAASLPNVTPLAMISWGKMNPPGDPEGMLFWWGTSFAAPLASGLAALIVGAIPGKLTPGRVKDLIAANVNPATRVINVRKTLDYLNSLP